MKAESNIIKKANRIVTENLAREDLREDTLLYVNYPFCETLCSFCKYKIAKMDKEKERLFFRAYPKEIELYKGLLGNFKFKNVHIGGGTPNLTTPESLLAPISDFFHPEGLDRLIVEVLPRRDIKEYIDELKSFAPTKIQLGVQTLCDELHRSENRSSDSGAAVESMEILKESGLNWSVDLIYGLKGEKECRRDTAEELREVLRYKPHGIHLYYVRSCRENDHYHESGFEDDPHLVREKDFSSRDFVDILSSAGYTKVYDEWCRKDNIEHAELTCCFNDSGGCHPHIVALGPGANSIYKFAAVFNFKSVSEYSRLLEKSLFPIERLYYIKKKEYYPILNIYTGIKRISRFDLEKFISLNDLSEGEKAVIDLVKGRFEKNKIPFFIRSGVLVIPKTKQFRALRVMEDMFRECSEGIW